MKLAFVVCTEFFTQEVMGLLAASGIDYYTRWDNALGKGHGTDPHMGRGSYGSTNTVLMIAFEDDAPLEKLVAAIAAANAGGKRPDEKIRLFQAPLERIV